MAEIVLNTVFKFKRGTAEAWLRHNPVLQAGEPGFELDTGKLKIGVGNIAWKDLEYLNSNEYSISPDGVSLAIDTNNKLTLYGFETAQTNSVPVKNAEGKIEWKVLNIGNKEEAGVTKLYSAIGDNTDGTMTQKAITDELNEKIEIELNHDEELLIFSY